MEFYQYLERQFNNLEEAKEWYLKWVNEWHQDIPGHPEWSGENCFSMQAMAGHISCCLTGEEYPGLYIGTKFGCEIFWGGIKGVINDSN